MPVPSLLSPVLSAGGASRLCGGQTEERHSEQGESLHPQGVQLVRRLSRKDHGEPSGVTAAIVFLPLPAPATHSDCMATRQRVPLGSTQSSARTRKCAVSCAAACTEQAPASHCKLGLQTVPSG